MGGCNIIEFAIDVELVFGLSFSSLALFSAQGLLDSFTGTCRGVLSLIIHIPKSIHRVHISSSASSADSLM